MTMIVKPPAAMPMIPAMPIFFFFLFSLSPYSPLVFRTSLVIEAAAGGDSKGAGQGSLLTVRESVTDDNFGDGYKLEICVFGDGIK